MLFKIKEKYLKNYTCISICELDEAGARFFNDKFINPNQIKGIPIISLSEPRNSVFSFFTDEIRRKVLINGEVGWIYEDCLEEF
jgi:hypothetical protein